jgi:hypothetical protein
MKKIIKEIDYIKEELKLLEVQEDDLASLITDCRKMNGGTVTHQLDLAFVKGKLTSLRKMLVRLEALL